MRSLIQLAAVLCCQGKVTFHANLTHPHPDEISLHDAAKHLNKILPTHVKKQVAEHFEAASLLEVGTTSRTKQRSKTGTSMKELSKVTAVLNSMVIQTQQQMDLTDQECQTQIESFHYALEENQQSRLQADTDIQLAEKTIQQATKESDGAQFALQELEPRFATTAMGCKQNTNTMNQELAMITQDLLVAQKIVGMSKCATAAAGKSMFLQCLGPATFAFVQLRQQVNSKQVVMRHKKSHKILKQTLASLGRAARAEKPRRKAEALLQRRLRRHAPRFNTVDLHSKFQALIANSTGFTPGDEEREVGKARCALSKKANCPAFVDAMGTMVGQIKDQKESLQQELEKEQGRCDDLLNSMKEAQQSAVVKYQGSQVTLNDGLAQKAQTEGQIKTLKNQFDMLNSDMTAKHQDCHEKMTELRGQMCGLKRMRKELYRLDNKRPWIQDCEVSEWRENACSSSCGGGTMVMTREVVVQAKMGAACPPLAMKKPCNQHSCPMDCVLGEWSGWSQCSKPCGGGSQMRIRDVEQEPQYNGIPCGETQESRMCNQDKCESECTLGPWSQWTHCTKACDTGVKFSHRRVAHEPDGASASCPGWQDPARLRFQKCNEQVCPADPKCDAMIDLVFIIDGSGSATTEGFEMQKAFVNAFVAKMNLGPTTGQVGVVMFSGTSNILTGLSSTAADITAKVTAVQWPQLTTNLAGAFKDAQAVLQEGRPDAMSVVFVLTDGDVASRKDALEAAHEVRRSARVIMAPLGPGAPREFVASLASLPPRANVLPVHEYLTTLSKPEEIKRMVTNVCPKIA
mmetsp:Transcript_52282/g.114761  ORF Transcript_52282/g.114761 Transcript_52282/m.114761 type:complete len:800 (+) Transcript_52282:93-2492(+)